MTGELAVGKKIMIQGNKTGVVDSKVSLMELDHTKVNSAKKGDRVAVKIKEKVRPNDKVFIVKKNPV